MPFKKHTPEEVIGKLREAEVVLAQGGMTADACRRLSISEHTYFGPDQPMLKAQYRELNEKPPIGRKIQR